MYIVILNMNNLYSSWYTCEVSNDNDLHWVDLISKRLYQAIDNIKTLKYDLNLTLLYFGSDMFMAVLV